MECVARLVRLVRQRLHDHARVDVTVLRASRHQLPHTMQAMTETGGPHRRPGAAAPAGERESEPAAPERSAGEASVVGAPAKQATGGEPRRRAGRWSDAGEGGQPDPRRRADYASITTGMIIGRRRCVLLTHRPTTRRTVCCSW